MNLIELVGEVRGLLNRDDLTDAQIRRFVRQSCTMLSRTLRIPSMEVTASYELAEADYVPLPGGYLELKHISVDNRPLDFMDFNHLNSLPRVRGTPTHFSRVADRWVFSPIPAPGSRVDVIYYADPAPLTTDTSTNSLTGPAEDAIIYGALVKACEFLVDERMPVFEAAMQREILSLMQQAAKTDYTGGIYAVRPVSIEY